MNKLPCSERDRSFPDFKAYCPSILAIAENAQQDPQPPYNCSYILINIYYNLY